MFHRSFRNNKQREIVNGSDSFEISIEKEIIQTYFLDEIKRINIVILTDKDRFLFILNFNTWNYDRLHIFFIRGSGLQQPGRKSGTRKKKKKKHDRN